MNVMEDLDLVPCDIRLRNFGLSDRLYAMSYNAPEEVDRSRSHHKVSGQGAANGATELEIGGMQVALKTECLADFIHRVLAILVRWLNETEESELDTDAEPSTVICSTACFFFLILMIAMGASLAGNYS